MRPSTPFPRTSTRSSGARPNQRASAGRWWIMSALGLQRSRQPITSYTVKAAAPPGFAATHECTPK